MHQADVGFLPQLISMLFIEAESLTELGPIILTNLAIQLSLGESCVSLLKAGVMVVATPA